MNKFVIKKSFYIKIFPLLIFFFISSCVTYDARIKNIEHAQHPSVKVFLEFEKEVKNTKTFDQGLMSFFSPKARREIETKKGWYRLVYTSTYRALRDGVCETINIIKESRSNVLLSCKGDYKFKSVFGMSSNERMHLRVNLRLIDDVWYLDKAGLTHTMGGGKVSPRSMGLKF